MAGSVSDEAFARAAQQAGMVSFDELEAARTAQTDSAKQGLIVSLADVLIQQGIITAATREKIEKRSLAERQGGLRQLGPYTLLRKLGEGGMGAVFLAEDTMAGRKVAVKVLPKKYSEDREFLTRFRREAQATGKLNHVNIVMAYNVGEDTGTHYYAMEHCDGETLDKILKRGEVLHWDKAVAVVLQVARGLKHAHEHGIIHRDIKPANIFICKPLGTPENVQVETFVEGFVAKILDLGLSKNISGEEQTFYTQTGVALGTPHYVSPEQAKGEKGIDGRTDIYSLGATLYHLVTGQTPFTGTTAAIVMMKHLSEQLPNPQDIRPDIPDGVVQVIIKMMAKDPADRYANCKELLSDLEMVIDGKTPSSEVIDVGKSSVAMPRYPQRTATAPRKTAGPLPPVGTRRHQPVGERRETGRRQVEEVPLVEIMLPVPSRRPLYIGLAALACGTVFLIGALIWQSGGDASETQKSEAAKKSETRSAKSDIDSKPESLKIETIAAKPAPPPIVTQLETEPAAAKPPAVAPEQQTEKGVTEEWIKKVQALPAEKQVEEVKEKLREINPAVYKILEIHKIEKGKVVELTLNTTVLSDVTAVRALRDLDGLYLNGTRVTDVAPLKGMRLRRLSLRGLAVNDISSLQGMPLRWLDILGTKVSDLSPLKDAPLEYLDCNGTKISNLAPLAGKHMSMLDIGACPGVTDLSPLKTMEIKWLICVFNSEHDAAALGSIKTLEKINGMPVSEFRAKYSKSGVTQPTADSGKAK